MRIGFSDRVLPYLYSVLAEASAEEEAVEVSEVLLDGSPEEEGAYVSSA